MSETPIFTDAPSDTGNGTGDADTSSPYVETPPTETTTAERRPERREPRTSTANLVSMLWGFAGMGLERSQTDIPVGRVLQFQAPVAGTKIDELIKHTWLDHAIQPFVKQAEKVEGLGALIVFPLLIGVWERNPELAPVVEGPLREVIAITLADMVPVMKKKKADARKTANALKDASELFDDLPPGTDPIDAILGSIFAMPPEPASEPEGEQ